MSIGLSLLAAIVDTRDARELLNCSLKEIDFTGDEQVIYDFINNHLRTYGVLPERRTIEVSTEVTLPIIPTEPISYWLDLFQQRSLGNQINDGITRVSNLMREGDYKGAADIISSISSSLASQNSALSLSNMSELAQAIVRAHDDRQYSRIPTNILYGLPYLDEISDGIQPGDTVALAGMTGVGKSYVLCHFANMAHQQGKTVLFVSTEMPAQQIASRILALKAGVPEHRISRGNLSTNITRPLIISVVEGLVNEAPLYLLDGKFELTTDTIMSYCKALQPDVVYVDGAYLLTVPHARKNASRWDNIADTAQQLKVMAGRLGVPIIGSYQANADKSIYGSKAIAHLASVVLFLANYKSKEEREPWEMIGQEKTLEIVKGRGGEQGKIKLIYDLSRGARIYQDEVLINFLEEEDEEHAEN